MPTPLDTALHTALAAHAGLGTLLGTGADFRCYPVEAPPQAALPLLVWQLVATDPATTHLEGSTDSRLDGHLVQFTALAATPLAAAAILYQVRLALEADAGLKAVQTDERTLPRAEEAQCHARSADFHLWHDPDA